MLRHLLHHRAPIVRLHQHAAPTSDVAWELRGVLCHKCGKAFPPVKNYAWRVDLDPGTQFGSTCGEFLVGRRDDQRAELWN